MKKLTLVLLVVVSILIVAGCAAPSTPQIIKETVVVEVTKEVEKVVEQTVVVEKEVQMTKPSFFSQISKSGTKLRDIWGKEAASSANGSTLSISRIRRNGSKAPWKRKGSHEVSH